LKKRGWTESCLEISSNQSGCGEGRGKRLKEKRRKMGKTKQKPILNE